MTVDNTALNNVDVQCCPLEEGYNNNHPPNLDNIGNSNFKGNSLSEDGRKHLTGGSQPNAKSPAVDSDKIKKSCKSSLK